MKYIRSFVSYWLPVLLWCALIYRLSSIPHLRFFQNGLMDFLFRKAGHMGEYGILARLLARAFASSTFWPWKRIFFCSLALAFFYACSDEFHQSYVPGRTAAMHDVAIDTAGAWISLGLAP